MTDSADKKTKSGPALTDKAKAEKTAREARLAQALRDNLRRRRRPGGKGNSDATDEDEAK